jgi:chemotaxis protein CheC
MGEFSLDNVNDMCLDVLKEIGNIGAGNATSAIANMIGNKIEMHVPTVTLMEASQLGSAICPEDEIIVGILLEVSHDSEGSIMFLMQMDSARYLVNKLLMGMGGQPEEGQEFSEMELSALTEIGNIIAGAYLAAVANMTQLTIQPSVPMIAVDMAAAILSFPATQFGLYGDNALFIETEFGSDVMINGYFIMMPDQESYGKILASLGIVI